MHYKDRLNHWAIVRLLPKVQQKIVVERHRTQSDAEGHCQIFQRLEPQSQFAVMFDPVQGG